MLRSVLKELGIILIGREIAGSPFAGFALAFFGGSEIVASRFK